MTPITEWTKDRFDEISAERAKRIDQASAAPIKDNPVNILAKRLHPKRQYMKIAKITEVGGDTKIFRLVPDSTRGTDHCAIFMAGQYLNVYLDIDGKKVNWPYSLSSSPKDAFDGFYELTVLSSDDGLVSKYMLDNWKEGDAVELSGPAGHFCYQPIRDAKTVVCLAERSGIAPFKSLANAIVDGDEDFKLVLLYASRTEAQILYKEEFDRLSQDGRITIVYVLSDEDKEGFEKGSIDAALIRKYAPESEPYSVFACLSPSMCRDVDKEIAKLGLERKYVRHEILRELLNASSVEDYPGAGQAEVKITVTIRDVTKTVTGSANDTILRTLEKNGIVVPTSCRSGECGFCHSTLVSGNVYVPKNMDGRHSADLKFNHIHPCVTFPLSDIEIIVPAD